MDPSVKKGHLEGSNRGLLPSASKSVQFRLLVGYSAGSHPNLLYYILAVIWGNLREWNADLELIADLETKALSLLFQSHRVAS